MPIISPHVCLMVLLGMVLGIIGFVPLYVAVRLTYQRRIEASVAKGMAVLGLSFVFYLTTGAAVWILAPHDSLTVIVGMLVGFFAMWVYLAYAAMKRRF